MRRVLRDISGEEATCAWTIDFEWSTDWPTSLVLSFQTIDDDYNLIKRLWRYIGRKPTTRSELAELAMMSKSKINRRVEKLHEHGIIAKSTDIDQRKPGCLEVLKKYFGEHERRRGRPAERIIFLPAFSEEEIKEIEGCMKWRFWGDF